MNIGLTLAIVSAICFAASTVSIRRGLFHAETALGAVFVSVPIGAVLSASVLIATAQYNTLWHTPWHTFAVLAIAGVITFVAGRLLNYIGIQNLGANRNGAILRTSPLWAAIFGVVFLDESLTILMISGILLVVAGATLVSVRYEKETRAVQVKGIIAASGGALLYAIAAALIKAVIKEAGSPITAAFISFTAGSIVLAGLLFHKQLRQQLLQLQRRSLIPFMIAGTMSTTAQLLRYSALDHSPVSLVEPIIGTTIIFVLIFSFFINRNIEIFNRKVVLGIMVAAIGAALLFI
jgi:drug/metabolite transporter (DMT)-like permease